MAFLKATRLFVLQHCKHAKLPFGDQAEHPSNPVHIEALMYFR